MQSLKKSHKRLPASKKAILSGARKCSVHKSQWGAHIWVIVSVAARGGGGSVGKKLT